jgi:hypothetical protein
MSERIIEHNLPLAGISIGRSVSVVSARER